MTDTHTDFSLDFDFDPPEIMSILPAETHAELAQLLQALQSADNSIRSQAEGHLQNNWTTTRPDILLMGLAEQIAASTETSVRIFFFIYIFFAVHMWAICELRD